MCILNLNVRFITRAVLMLKIPYRKTHVRGNYNGYNLLYFQETKRNINIIYMNHSIDEE